jgi:hypothetical protein
MFQNDPECFEESLRLERIGYRELGANAQGFHRIPPCPHSA